MGSSYATFARISPPTLGVRLLRSEPTSFAQTPPSDPPTEISYSISVLLGQFPALLLAVNRLFLQECYDSPLQGSITGLYSPEAWFKVFRWMFVCCPSSPPLDVFTFLKPISFFRSSLPRRLHHFPHRLTNFPVANPRHLLRPSRSAVSLLHPLPPHFLRRNFPVLFSSQTNLQSQGVGMLDINLFREDKGNDPERIRESQRRRGSPVDLVDEIIRLDKEWRQRQYELDSLRKDFNRMNKEIAQLKIEKQDAAEKIKSTNENKRATMEKTEEVQQAKTVLETKLSSIGNLVHDSVPISMDEADNAVVKMWGERRMEGKFLNHVDLVEKLGIADLKKGANVAGGRGYYLKGDGVLLNIALINFGIAFLRKRKFEPLQTPYFMRKDIMSKCAQLAQFDEELYKVTGEGDDKYLIATSEQPLCAYHLDERIYPSSLPLRYAGFSTCFRKEAGSHGRDTLGIFRVHQFEKIEQFCITSPNENESWEMQEEMLLNSEKFYQELNLPYQVVSIVSGALNDAAAKKYDLEGWFPSSKTYRELVSCSNCTDYQARRLGIAYGQKKNDEQTKQYVHMLNSTLTATERTICCILENHQRGDGVAVPEALQPYMGGIDFLPFKN